MIALTLNDGSTIPWLGFGTGTALFGKDAANSVTVAIENGITHLDGAQIYRNEESLGSGIKGIIAHKSIYFTDDANRSIRKASFGALHHYKTERVGRCQPPCGEGYLGRIARETWDGLRRFIPNP